MTSDTPTEMPARNHNDIKSSSNDIRSSKRAAIRQQLEDLLPAVDQTGDALAAIYINQAIEVMDKTQS